MGILASQNPNSCSPFTGGPGNQDNINKVKNFNYSGPKSNAGFADLINTAAPFSIGGREIFYFSTFSPATDPRYPTAFTFILLNNGKGTYGVGGTQVMATDIKVLSATLPTSSSIEDIDATLVLEVGNSTGYSISDWINGKVPSVFVQDQADGYTIIKTTVDGNELVYLFVGAGGTYGLVDEQTTDVDLVLLSDEIAPADQTFSKLFVWNTGDPLSFPVDPGVAAKHVFINDVPYYHSTDYPALSKWSQAAPGANVIINSSVLFDDNSRIYITN